MSLNLGDLLANSARRYGNETALIDGESRFAYQWLDDRVRAFAADLLEGGLQRGDKVVLMLPNGPPFTIAYFGVLYAGGVAVTVGTLQVAEEVAYQLSDCDAKVLVIHRDLESGLEAFGRTEGCRALYVVGAGGAAVDGARRFEDALQGEGRADVCLTGSDDTAVILYTSGTTGHPKGAELTHFNLFYNAQLVNERIFSEWPEKVKIMGPGDVAIAALPLYHIFGQTNVQNGMLFGGAALTYVKRFDPVEVVRIIARDRVTFFPGVPTMYFAILHDEAASKAADLSSVKSCISGGAPIPVEVKRRFSEQFNVRIQEGYGLTETSPLAAVQRPSEYEKAGTIGKPVDGVEIQIWSDQDQKVPQGERGEIVIRGHNIMKGYYKRPKATAEAFRGGWFHSGDIGYVDEEGDIFIVDRKKDMILRGGFNVYPREVEEVLYTHPGVREAAVVGVPDEKLGEEVKAVVSLKGEVTGEQIVEFCKKHLAAYKYPRIVEIVDELPKGSTGKILKRALRS